MARRTITGQLNLHRIVTLHTLNMEGAHEIGSGIDRYGSLFGVTTGALGRFFRGGGIVVTPLTERRFRSVEG